MESVGCFTMKHSDCWLWQYCPFLNKQQTYITYEVTCLWTFHLYALHDEHPIPIYSVWWHSLIAWISNARMLSQFIITRMEIEQMTVLVWSSFIHRCVVIGMVLTSCNFMQLLRWWIRLSLAKLHRSAAQQIKLLTRKICLADFFGYQPNFHTKCMHCRWLSVLYCLAKIFA